MRDINLLITLFQSFTAIALFPRGDAPRVARRLPLAIIFCAFGAALPTFETSPQGNSLAVTLVVPIVVDRQTRHAHWCMSLQFVSDQISPGPQQEASASALIMNEDRAIQIAPHLRQLSRELRAASKSLQLRNSAVMSRADDVAVRCCGSLFAVVDCEA